MDLFRRLRDALGLGPKLNCKPADLARVIDHPSYGPIDKQCIGMIVKVTRVIPHTHSGEPCWEYEGPRIIVGLGPFLVTITGFCDDCLCPIRNPGDEEQDEIVGLVGPAPAVDAPVRVPAKV